MNAPAGNQQPATEPVWLLWFRTRQIPDDWAHRCAICGKQGKPIGAGLTAFSEMVMINFLNDGAGAAGKKLREGAYSFLGSVLVPYHPVLEDGPEAKAIVRFFGNKELRACSECMAGMKRPAGPPDDDDDDRWAL